MVTEAPECRGQLIRSQILTINDGHVWLFVAVEHFNSECVGWHVSKPGTKSRPWSRLPEGPAVCDGVSYFQNLLGSILNLFRID